MFAKCERYELPYASKPRNVGTYKVLCKDEVWTHKLLPRLILGKALKLKKQPTGGTALEWGVGK
jgi:hypothetical protein